MILSTVTHLAVLAQAVAAPSTTAVPDPGIVPQPPAMSGLPGGALGGTITLSLLFVALVLGWFAVKHAGGKLRDITIGAVIGVLGAGGVVGSLVWVVVRVGVQVINSVGAAVGS